LRTLNCRCSWLPKLELLPKLSFILGCNFWKSDGSSRWGRPWFCWQPFNPTWTMIMRGVWQNH
jgi:hypothetical protein